MYAARIRDAMAGSIDTQKLAGAWAGLHPKDVGKAISPALSAFLARASAAIQNALKTVLTRLWTEAWVLGNRSALAAVTGLDPDWGTWTPGDYAAADQIAGPGLRQLLGEAGIRIKSIADSRLEELAQVLEDTLRSDAITREPGTGPLPPFLSVGDLAQRLEGVLDNPDRAELVAQAEIARAQATAARQVYLESGRTEVEVSTAEDARVCPVCEAAEKLGPHPIGVAPLVPLHPRCRCAELPVLAGATLCRRSRRSSSKRVKSVTDSRSTSRRETPRPVSESGRETRNIVPLNARTRPSGSWPASQGRSLLVSTSSDWIPRRSGRAPWWQARSPPRICSGLANAHRTACTHGTRDT